MRLKTYPALVAALFASNIVASEIPTTTASTGARLDDLIPSSTPFPAPNLELRQNLGQDLHPSAKPAAGDQVPPVTVYSILTQVGATAKGATYTYTQTFARVPDQFPAARPGQIGIGNRKEKREAVPTPIVNTGYVAQPLVLQMETVMVTQLLQRVTEVWVLETWTVNVRNQSAASNATVEVRSNSLPASLGTRAYRPLPTALT